MTSKEAIEEIKTVLSTNPGTKQYADIFQEHLLNHIEKDLEVLEQFETLKNYYRPFKTFLNDMFEKGHNEDLTHIKEWLEK